MNLLMMLVITIYLMIQINTNIVFGYKVTYCREYILFQLKVNS